MGGWGRGPSPRRSQGRRAGSGAGGSAGSQWRGARGDPEEEGCARRTSHAACQGLAAAVLGTPGPPQQTDEPPPLMGLDLGRQKAPCPATLRLSWGTHRKSGRTPFPSVLSVREATAGLRPGARLLRVCGRPLPRLGPGAATALLRSAPKVCVTVLLPDESGRPRRSFSELYEMSLQEPGRRGLQGPGSEGSPGAGLLPVTVQMLHSLCLQDGSPAPGPLPGLTEERTEFLHSQSGHSPLSTLADRVPVLPDATPDLLLVATPKPPQPDQTRDVTPDKALPDSSAGQEALENPTPLPRELSDSFLPRTLSLRNSISKILSEAGSEPLEEEWKSISEIASTCNSILEALSQEGQQVPESGDPREAPKAETDPSPGSLSEKVSHLENMLKKLQDDLQKEKADKAALQEEVRNLRHNNRRLQAESQSAAARLLRASQQLGTPGP
ncbi:signal-induced proliferation-associated protein 1 [Gracilinanus agilis]|uniref:signal-induced proliferation-associated protein 1 n=1 Tax=Gracilinanus agilis TaxID=191870 RepID=UPI001CFCB9E2|nr:signal-induced proliferation-associated protein 1 [Gracilinanus agilis]